MLYGALLACVPFGVYILFPTGSNPYAYGAQLVWGGGLLVVPSAFIGLIIGAICWILGGLVRRRLNWRGPVSLSLTLGLAGGMLGAVPLGILAGSTELKVDVPSAIWLFGLYLVLVFGGYGLWWVMRDGRRASRR